MVPEDDHADPALCPPDRVHRISASLGARRPGGPVFSTPPSFSWTYSRRWRIREPRSKRPLIASGSLVDSYIYLWVYEVSPEAVDDFCELYGPDGAWVALFRQAPGYLDTQLLEDRHQMGRFVTIDRWESEEAFSNFRAAFEDHFDHLDHLGEELTVRETPLGEFRVHRRH